VIKHAFIPAVISYIALVYIVHLEALKTDMPALGESKSLLGMLLKVFVGFAVAGVVFYGLVWGVGALQRSAPGLAPWVLILGLAALYLWALIVAARLPDLELDDPHAKKIVLPVMAEVVPRGLHFLLPILVLVWYLMVERQSPAKSAFYAVLVMVVILLTQKPIKALLRGQSVGPALRAGWDDLIDGMIAGARNMIGIAVATGAAGIIVATVTRTPIGTELAGLVEFLSGGNLFLMLVLVGVFSLILGLGLPTTANYIVVSSLMATVVVSVGAQEGLIIPLIAAHLFVFYFGIMADVTPPVGLASFAAAAVSGGDPIKTGLISFLFSMRTIALPFLFIYNPALILYGIDLGTAAGILLAVKVFIVATFAMLLFAAATQGYFLARSRLWESAALLLVAFTLFVPNFWLDQVQPRYVSQPGTEFETVLSEAEAGDYIRFVVAGPDFTTGAIRRTTLVLTVDDTPAAQQVAGTGLFLMPDGERMAMDEPMPATAYSDVLRSFDFYGDTPVEIVSVERPNDRFPQELFYIPALLLLGVVILFQRRRQTKPAF